MIVKSTLKGLAFAALTATSTLSAFAANPRVFSTPAADNADKPASVSERVEIDVPSLMKMVKGDSATLKLPGGREREFRFDRTATDGLGNHTWVGYLADQGTEYRAILTFDEKGTAAFGTILTPEGEYKVQTLKGKKWLIDMHGSNLSSPPEPVESDAIPATPDAASALSNSSKKSKSDTTTESVTTAVAEATVSGSTTIDVLVLYTPGMKTKYGSQLMTRISHLVAISNQAYIDSGINLQQRLVGAELINTTDQTSNSTTLSSLKSGSGVFSGVPALRTKYGADIVHLIRPFYMSAQGGNCGVGYISGYNLQPVSYFKNSAFSVSSDGKDSAGTNYYCNEYTYTHELGHNMGSMHDRATVTKQGGGQGAYPYSFGYGTSGVFGTIMSYINPVIGRFSNPDQYTCAGTRQCGVAETSSSSANNSHSLNNTAAAIAAFMPTTISARFTISGTVTRGTAALANVSFTITGSNVWCNGSSSTGLYSCSVPAGWSGTITPVLSGAVFTPVSKSFTAVSANLTGQNFVAK